MSIIYNKKENQENRRRLRKDSTTAENILWISLRKKQVLNVRFLRQYSINRFIVDFYSPKIKLAIETDGDTHFESDAAIQYDKRRQKYIEELGIVFLRFKNEDIFFHMDEVMKQIEAKVMELLQNKGKTNPL